MKWFLHWIVRPTIVGLCVRAIYGIAATILGTDPGTWAMNRLMSAPSFAWIEAGRWAIVLMVSAGLLVLYEWWHSRHTKSTNLGALSPDPETERLAAIARAAQTERSDKGARSPNTGTLDGIPRSQWQKEWDDQAKNRNEFWKQVNAAYQKWNSRPEWELQDALRAAPIPKELLQCDDKTFWELFDGGQFSLSEDQVRIFDFARFIYSDAGERLGELEGFDIVRMNLSKFWDRWGRETPIEATIYDHTASGILASSAPELKLLTFLEMARALYRSTGATSKSGLFRLSRYANSDETGPEMISLHGAARIAYEELRGTIGGRQRELWESNPTKILGIVAQIIVDHGASIPIYGVFPPSRKRERIPEEEAQLFQFTDNADEFYDVFNDLRRYVSLTIRRADFKRRLAEMKAKAALKV